MYFPSDQAISCGFFGVGEVEMVLLLEPWKAGRGCRLSSLCYREAGLQSWEKRCLSPRLPNWFPRLVI